jgi:hypothetical protein
MATVPAPSAGRNGAPAAPDLLLFHCGRCGRPEVEGPGGAMWCPACAKAPPAPRTVSFALRLDITLTPLATTPAATAPKSQAAAEPRICTALMAIIATLARSDSPLTSSEIADRLQQQGSTSSEGYLRRVLADVVKNELLTNDGHGQGYRLML